MTGFIASCFDLLHAGHCLMLKDAKEQCDLGSDYREKVATGQEFSDKVYYHDRNHNWSTSELRLRISNKSS